MPTESPFAGSPRYPAGPSVEYRGARLAAVFRTLGEEYVAARERAVLFDRTHRGLVRATGRDRLSWLHNMVTNAVKTLEPGHGNYAFACDVQGRIQFDLNILALPDALWLDFDLAALPGALKHLDRFLITEDVKLRDESAEWARLGVVGPEATAIARALGVDHFIALPDLAHVTLPDGVVFVRHPIVGSLAPGFELIVPVGAAAGWWTRMVELGAAPAGFETFELLRIEAGIPALGADLDSKVLPAETGQIERAVSYHKGCYLGQEVIERMRSRGSLARRLVKLSLEDGTDVTLPAPLVQSDKEVGRLTSAARRPTRGEWIGLGYLRSAITDATGVTVGTPARSVSLRG